MMPSRGALCADITCTGWVNAVASRLSPSKESPVEDLKRSETLRGTQHKIEDVKDKADTKFYDTTSKAEWGYSHAQKEVCVCVCVHVGGLHLEECKHTKAM